MRATNRIIATLLALAILAIAVVTIAEIMLASLGKSPWIVQHAAIARDLHQRTWQDGLVRVVAVAATVLGLVLLFVGLKPSAPTDLPLQSDVDGVTLTVERKSLERFVTGIADAQPGVDTASASAGRGRVGIKASTTLQDPGDLKERVQSAVTGRLEDLRPAEQLKTSVSIDRRESS